VLLGQSPLHLLGTGDQRRHFTAAADVARGLIAAMTAPSGLAEDFNLATPESHSVREVAKLIWDRMKPSEVLRFVSDPPLLGDVAQRAPSTDKAKRLLGFCATVPLTAVLDEVIPWVTEAFEEVKL
jgi:nucleoside-diphosphate-sugar epimerase